MLIIRFSVPGNINNCVYLLKINIPNCATCKSYKIVSGNMQEILKWSFTSSSKNCKRNFSKFDLCMTVVKSRIISRTI